MLTSKILSDSHVSATNEIGDSSRQQTLGLGPTGRVHRGGAVPWHKRLALTKAPSPTAHHVLLVLGSFVSDGQSDAWPSVATLSAMSGLSRRAVQTALRALEGANLVTTDTVPGRSSRYRLAASTCAPPAPPPAHLLRPTCASPAPEVLMEGTRGSKAAQPIQTLGDPKADRADRVSCPKCGNDWPRRFGTRCFTCRGSVSGSGGYSHPAGLAAPQSGKYAEFDTDAPRLAPDIPTLSGEARARLELEAAKNGYRKVAGKWTKAN